MKLNKKKILFLVLILGIAFVLTGCKVPTEIDPETGKSVVKLIKSTTTFKEVFDNESWFNAILVWPLCQLINKFGPKYGIVLTITIVTILVNLITLPLTLKSTVQSQQMQMIQPQMNKIQRKYEGKTDEASKMKQAQEMQALYNKYNINPLGSLLMPLLQFPIIIAMYQAVQRSYEVRYGTFLGYSLGVTPLEGVKNGQYIYLVIFIFMAVCQFVSMMLPQWLAKRKAKIEALRHHRKPEDTSQPNQGMMYSMMIPILIISLMWPTAMSVYWAINSLINIVKTYVTQVLFIDKKETTA